MKNKIHDLIIQYKWILLSALILLIAVVILVLIYSKSNKEIFIEAEISNAPFLSYNEGKIDTLIKNMTLEEKAGQLIMIAVDDSKSEKRLLESYINDYHAGGFYLAGGSFNKNIKIIGELNNNTVVPLLTAVSAEYGLFFPSDTISKISLLPAINAISDDSVIIKLARLTAGQLRQNRLMMNFAPCLNAIFYNTDYTYDFSYALFINDISKKALLFMKTMQGNGILSCAYKYPNYKTRGNILYQVSDTIRNHPFNKLINAGLSAIIVSHSSDEATDSTDYSIYDSLHSAFSYGGITISDFYNDTYYRNKGKPGEAELLALKNGSDIVMIGDNINQTYDFLISAIKNNALTAEEVDSKVKKILKAKYWADDVREKFIESDTAIPLNYMAVCSSMFRKAVQSSLTLVTNRKKIVPIKELSNQKIAVLRIESRAHSVFTSAMYKYSDVASFTISADASDNLISSTINRLKNYNCVIVGIFPDIKFITNKNKINKYLHQLESSGKLIVAHFGCMESLALLDKYPAIIQAYSDDPITQSIVAQSIFGGAKLPSKLPYSCSQKFCYADANPVKKQIRLKYSIPEEASLNSICLNKIDSIINQAIISGAFPGCQVFAARKNIVILNKSYGFHKYDRKEKVENSDLYDLASVTKVAATTIAVMALYNDGKIRLDTTINYYFNDLDKNSHDKKVRDSKLNYITLQQLMTHTSGLPAALPIGRFISPKWYLTYMMELENRRAEIELTDTTTQEEEYYTEWAIDTSQLMISEDSIFQWLFSKEKDNEHKIQIGEGFFMRSQVIDSVWQLAKQTGVRKSCSYLYSDMNFYLVMKIVETVAKAQIDKFVTERFYRPMNLNHICYTPLKYYKKEKVVPTEEEKIFRKQLIQGFVHDPTAAILGGISGNAGLFSNAEDLGILMQMLLNGGTYGGKNYMSANTVKLFTKVQEGGYRGLGWDHQTKSGMKMVAAGASPETYGHTGFTGTCVWVDPVNEIVFVFLSNRVHPKSTNQKINGMRVRQNVQQALYNAIM